MPNSIETNNTYAYYGLNPFDPDTFNMADIYSWYAGNGDDEFLPFIAEANACTVHPDKDW